MHISKRIKEIMKMWKGNKMCDITEKFFLNGGLSDPAPMTALVPIGMK